MKKGNPSSRDQTLSKPCPLHGKKMKIYSVEKAKLICARCIDSESKGSELKYFNRVSDLVEFIEQKKLEKKRRVGCEKHPSEKGELYCEKEKSVFCKKYCVMAHKAHPFCELSEKSAPYLEMFEGLSQDIDALVKEHNTKVLSIENSLRRLEAVKMANLKQLAASFDALRRTLNEEEQKLKAKIIETYQRHIEKPKKNLEKINEALIKVESFQESYHKLLTPFKRQVDLHYLSYSREKKYEEQTSQLTAHTNAFTKLSTLGNEIIEAKTLMEIAKKIPESVTNLLKTAHSFLNPQERLLAPSSTSKNNRQSSSNINNKNNTNINGRNLPPLYFDESKRLESNIYNKTLNPLCYLQSHSKRLHYFSFDDFRWRMVVLDGGDGGVDGGKIALDCRSILTTTGVLYFGGGVDDGMNKLARMYAVDMKRVIDEVDPKVEIKEVPDMRVGRSCHSFVVMGQCLYAIGGQTNTSGYLANCEKLDLMKNEWSPIADLKSGRQSHASCSFSDKYIYVFGGLDKDGHYLKNPGELLEFYDPAENKWMYIDVAAGVGPTISEESSGVVPHVPDTDRPSGSMTARSTKFKDQTITFDAKALRQILGHHGNYNGGKHGNATQISPFEILIFGGIDGLTRVKTNCSYVYDARANEIRPLKGQLGTPEKFQEGAQFYRDKDDVESVYALAYKSVHQREIFRFNPVNRTWNYVFSKPPVVDDDDDDTLEGTRFSFEPWRTTPLPGVMNRTGNSGSVPKLR